MTRFGSFAGAIVLFLCTASLEGQTRARYQVVSTGGNHSCAISEQGIVHCWGVSTDGRLGVDPKRRCATTLCADAPIPVTGEGFRQVSAGSSHTCALMSDGSALCTGDGYFLFQGRTGRAMSAKFTAVSGGPFLRISAGNNFTCAIAGADSAAFCWGRGKEGQLGAGATADTALPLRVDSKMKFTAIDAGDSFACALASDGSAWCWGRGNEGQLGNDAIVNSAVPVKVLGDRRYTSITVGGAHACGLAADSVAYCWGRGKQGQTQFGVKQQSNVPVPAVDKKLIDVSAGSTFTCGIDSERNAYCWGEERSGALGGSQGSKELRVVTHGPGTEYGRLSYGFRSISAGEKNTCGVVMDWSVWCWGNGGDGQLGNSKYSASYPMPVSPPRQ